MENQPITKDCTFGRKCAFTSIFLGLGVLAIYLMVVFPQSGN